MTQNPRNIIMTMLEEMAAHGHEGPFVALIPLIYKSPLDDVATMNTDYGAVEVIRRRDIGPNVIIVQTKADYLEWLERNE